LQDRQRTGFRNKTKSPSARESINLGVISNSQPIIQKQTTSAPKVQTLSTRKTSKRQRINTTPKPGKTNSKRRRSDELVDFLGFESINLGVVTNSQSIIQKQTPSAQTVQTPSTRSFSVKPYRCSEHRLRFSTNDELQNHYKFEHEGKIKCSFCEYRVKFPCQMKQHELSHSNIRDFKCCDCLKEFKTIGALKKHQQFYTPKERNYGEKCNKKKLTAKTLKGHSKICGLKVPCPVCGNMYSKGYLNAHIMNSDCKNKIGEFF
jgi:hypothetical protein